MKSIWDTSVVEELASRLDKLSPASKPLWGKMSVGQMLAHCNVTYELVYEDKHPKPGFLMRLILRTVVKNAVVSEKPFKHNLATGPVFIIKETKDFAAEKRRLVDHLHKTRELGESHFDGKESVSFGVMDGGQWNNMFYKHLNHHLQQFGA